MRYQVKVTAADGGFVCGATLTCTDDVAAVRRFNHLPLPPGRAELRLGQRVVASRVSMAPMRTPGLEPALAARLAAVNSAHL
jgi:hypothetical protein